MARRLSTLGRTWTLYLCARTPERAAFLDELEALPGTVIPVFDRVPGGASIDLERVIGDAPADAHLYCCGPTGLMEAFERAAVRREAHTVRRVVQAAPASAATDVAAASGSFELKLAHSGVTLAVPPRSRSSMS
jgi:vanillate O-demethylase ferredoxin subunit